MMTVKKNVRVEGKNVSTRKIINRPNFLNSLQNFKKLQLTIQNYKYF